MNTISGDLVARCERIARNMRQSIVRMTYLSGDNGAHIGGSLSLVEILATLYGGVMRIDTKNPDWKLRDRLILSKGHAAMALYAALAEVDVIGKDDLETFKQDGGLLFGHPSLNGVPGIEFASGSLGQGLSLAVGSSIALKMLNNNVAKVYVIIGDGECDEGSIWEAALSASHYALNNIIAIVDVNKLQYDGETNNIMSLTSLADKWRSFGWIVKCIDGHNIVELLSCCSCKFEKPMVILADTIKGKGISFMEGNVAYHNASLSNKLYELAMCELREENGF